MDTDAGQVIARDFGRRLDNAKDKYLPHVKWQDISDRCDLNPSTLVKIRNGETKPNLATAVAIVTTVANWSREAAQTLLPELNQIRRNATPEGELDMNRDGKVDMNDAMLMSLEISQAAHELQKEAIHAAADKAMTEDVYLRIDQQIALLRRYTDDYAATAKLALNAAKKAGTR